MAAGQEHDTKASSSAASKGEAKRMRRRVFALLSLFVFVAILLSLVLLRSGRPIYYTAAGAANAASAPKSAHALRNASMLVFDAPRPDLELLGPVRGRSAALPDGRLVYARKCGQPLGRETELVLFDPQRPRLEPELLVSIDGPSHDLAPAFGVDGRLYFASDREGPGGGFDLWSARWNGRGFDDLRALPPTINGPLDETDPAPHSDGLRVVFARRDPWIARGAHAVLHVASLSGTEPARKLFDDAGDEGPYPSFFDRDPCFDAAGEVLYFVRRFEDGRRRLLHSWVEPSKEGLAFVAPLAVPGLEALGSLRGPRPSNDGRGLLLVDEKSSLQYQASARIVRPWWAGQGQLEAVLAIVAAIAFLLFLLFAVGGRWTALDLITQCLLASLLLHLVLLLWLMRVEIVRTFLPPVPELGDDTATVRILSAAELKGDRAPDAEPARAASDLGQRLEFKGFERDLGVEAPSAELSARSDERATPTALPLPTVRAQQALAAALDGPRVEARDVTSDLQAIEVKDGRDSTAKAAAVEVSTEKLVNPSPSPERSTAAFDLEVAAPQALDVVAADVSSVVARSLPPPTRPESATQVASVAAPEASAAVEAKHAIAAKAVTDAPLRGRAADAPLTEPTAVSTATSRFEASPRALREKADVQRSADDVAAAAASMLPETRPIASDLVRPAPQAPVAKSADSDLAPRELAVAAPALRDATRPASELASKAATKSEAAPALRAAATDVARAREAALATVSAELGDAERDLASIAPPAPSLTTSRRRRAPPPSAERRSTAVTSGALVAVKTPELGTAAAAPPLASPALRGGEGDALRESAIEARSLKTERATTAALGAPQRSGEPLRAEGVVAAATLPPPRFRLERRSGALSPPLDTGRRSAVTGDGPKVAPGVAAAAVAVDDAAAPRAPRDAHARSSEALDRRPEALAMPAIAQLSAKVAAPRRDEPRRRSLTASVGSVPAPSVTVDRAQRQAGRRPRSEKVASEPSFYANRFGQKKVEALERFGGTQETELAVQRGLRYLARIQREDGGWGDVDDVDEKYGEVRVGKTALCLLAFLGAGNLPPQDLTPSTTNNDDLGKGLYASNVTRALRYLLSTQDEESGHFGRSTAYSHGITTYALAECYALTKIASLTKPLQHAVDWIVEQQNVAGPKDSLGGWGYYSPFLRPEDRYARASVTSWQVMALESARRSGIDVPERSLELAKGFLLSMFDDRYGYFLYTKEPQRLRMTWRTLPASTPASVFCLLLLGQDPEDERVEAGLRYTTDRRIERYARASDDDFVQRGAGNPYFWYYGTLACFFRGGEAWRLWNEKLRVELPRGQSEDGSFAPVGAYARYAKDTRRDRSYTTAMCVLSLEVYYRYFTPLLEKREGKLR